MCHICCEKGGKEVPGAALSGVENGGWGWGTLGAGRRGVLPAGPTSKHGPVPVTPAGMPVQAGKAHGMVVQSRKYPLGHSQLCHAWPVLAQKVPSKKTLPGKTSLPFSGSFS